MSFSDLPTEIWKEILVKACCPISSSLLDVLLISRTCYDLVMSDNKFWRSQLKSIAKGMRFKKNSLSYLNTTVPEYDLIRTLTSGRFLLLSNYGASWFSEAVKFINERLKHCDTVVINNTYSEQTLKVLNNLEGYDAILVDTNYGWSSPELHEKLGDIFRRLIDKGVGIVTTVFFGCSWVESFGGEWMRDCCNPIVPNVDTNNIDGSQSTIQLELTDVVEDHFMFNFDVVNTVKGRYSSISLGKANSDGIVLAKAKDISTRHWRSDESIGDGCYPFLVELNKWKGTIVSVNFTADKCPDLLILALLYVAIKKNKV